MDRLINVKIGGSHLWKDSKLAGVQHEANVTRLRVSFDEGWDGFAKKVTFWDAKGLNPVERTLTVDLLEDITKSTRIYLFPIPGEAMTEAGMMSFVIEGYVDGKVARTVGTELEVEYSPKADNAGQPADPTPSQAEQLQVQIENIIGDMQEQAIIATDAANNAKASEDNAKVSEEATERAQQAVENMTVTGEIVDPHSNLPALERSVEDGVVHLHLNIRQGFSGVYVGDGEMPEGYNVQVDPNGTGMDVPAIIESALQEAKDSGRFDGVSPSVKVTHISGGTRVTITDANGTKTFDVMNGKGGTGDGGGGADGVTFYPYVDENGNLSWTNDGGLDNPDPVNIMGRPGDPGDPGDPGVGISSIQFTESSGDYANNILKITTTDGKSYTFNVKNGGPGTPGNPGDPGDPGANATINGVNALTLATGAGLSGSQSGSTYTLTLATHNQAASTITGGTFAGEVAAAASAQTPGNSLLRNSALVIADTTPSNNGEIFWTYG